MTGVHRTDVAQIRSEASYQPREKHTASDVINQWRYDERFCLRRGKPRPLSFDGKSSEFAELAILSAPTPWHLSSSVWA
jgi:hypothetical protein